METERMDGEKSQIIETAMLELWKEISQINRRICAGVGTNAVADWSWCYCVCVCAHSHVSMHVYVHDEVWPGKGEQAN